MTEGKARSATVGDPTSPSCISHPLEFTEIDLGPLCEPVAHPLSTEGALIELESPQQAAPAAAPEVAADSQEDTHSVIWDLPPPDFNGPSSDAAPPAYDEALTCGTECPPLPRHPYQGDFDFDLEESRRNAEMRLEIALIKANRKKMYINFILGLLFFLVVLVICRFTIFNVSPAPALSQTTVPTTTTTEAFTSTIPP